MEVISAAFDDGENKRHLMSMRRKARKAVDRLLYPPTVDLLLLVLLLLLSFFLASSHAGGTLCCCKKEEKVHDNPRRNTGERSRSPIVPSDVCC
jgi:hypothetical protein